MLPANYLTTWAFGTHQSLEDHIAKNLPQEAHRWPLLRAFDVIGHDWNSTHLILVLRNKFSGISNVGYADPKDSSKAPTSPPSLATLEEWQAFIRDAFNVREQDFAMIIPAKGKGNQVGEDWKEWTADEQQLWRKQLNLNVTRHFYWLKGFDMAGDFFLPPGYQFLANECSEFLKDHKEYTHNVMIMTRFVPGNRLLETLDQELRGVLRLHGLTPLRADDKMYLADRNLWNNVCVYMLCCKYGVAILEDRVANEFNPNVALEYGFMRALNKRVLLLADTGFRNLRADIIGTLRETFDITDIGNTIKSPVEKWLTEVGLLSTPPRQA